MKTSSSSSGPKKNPQENNLQEPVHNLIVLLMSLNRNTTQLNRAVNSDKKDWKLLRETKQRVATSESKKEKKVALSLIDINTMIKVSEASTQQHLNSTTHTRTQSVEGSMADTDQSKVHSLVRKIPIIAPHIKFKQHKTTTATKINKKTARRVGRPQARWRCTGLILSGQLISAASVCSYRSGCWPDGSRRRWPIEAAGRLTLCRKPRPLCINRANWEQNECNVPCVKISSALFSYKLDEMKLKIVLCIKNWVNCWALKDSFKLCGLINDFYIDK